MGVKIQGFNEMMATLSARAQRIVENFLMSLDYLGLQSVRYIRDRTADESWMDQTGNLRSSIGYIVVHDGEIRKSGGFERVNGPKRDKSSADGSAEGRSYAERLAANYPTGYALIVVAGMEYAAYVEAKANKDVLAGGEIFLKKEVRKLVRRFSQKYGGER